MVMSMNEVINELVKSIKDRTVVKIKYRGEPQERIVEPYVLGVNHLGNTLLRAYQQSGFSSSKNVEGWKLFNVELIEYVESLQSEGILVKFDPKRRPEYNPNDKVMTKIIVNVKK
jgi:predicted DNA-binding transcriptional regulator YafY